MDNAELKNVVNPNEEKPQINKIVKYILIIGIVIAVIYFARKMFFNK